MITYELPEGLDYVRFGDAQTTDEYVLQLVPGGYRLTRGSSGVIVKLKPSYQLTYDPATDTSSADKDLPAPQTITVTVTVKSARQKATLNNLLRSLQKGGITAQIVP
jgi:hypothetical protein